MKHPMPNSLTRFRKGGDGLDRRTVVIAAVVVIGAFMSILDTTIVNVALATLSRELHSPLDTIQWVATGYLVALAVVIPMTGWASERFGAKRLWMTVVALFIAGSALSGLAWSADSLIFFRVLQGLGGGMILPAGMTILAEAAGPKRVGRVMSIVGVPMLLGPVIGGLILQNLSWNWIFFVNVPIGILALVLGHRLLPRSAPQPCDRLDIRGLALLSPGLAAIVYGLSETSSAGGIAYVGAWAPILAGIALVAAFAWHALHVRAAAYATITQRDVPQATTVINVFQRVGGSIGTALLAVVLEGQIRTSAPAALTSGSVAPLSAAIRSHLAAPLATAFDHTMWLAVALTAAAAIPALVLALQQRRAASPTPSAQSRAIDRSTQIGGLPGPAASAQSS